MTPQIISHMALGKKFIAILIAVPQMELLLIFTLSSIAAKAPSAWKRFSFQHRLNSATTDHCYPVDDFAYGSGKKVHCDSNGGLTTGTSSNLHSQLHSHEGIMTANIM